MVGSAARADLLWDNSFARIFCKHFAMKNGQKTTKEEKAGKKAVALALVEMVDGAGQKGG